MKHPSLVQMNVQYERPPSTGSTIKPTTRVRKQAAFGVKGSKALSEEGPGTERAGPLQPLKRVGKRRARETWQEERMVAILLRPGC